MLSSELGYPKSPRRRVRRSRRLKLSGCVALAALVWSLVYQGTPLRDDGVSDLPLLRMGKAKRAPAGAGEPYE
jgi:hypothetical protein